MYTKMAKEFIKTHLDRYRNHISAGLIGWIPCPYCGPAGVACRYPDSRSRRTNHSDGTTSWEYFCSNCQQKWWIWKSLGRRFEVRHDGGHP